MSAQGKRSSSRRRALCSPPSRRCWTRKGRAAAADRHNESVRPFRRTGATEHDDRETPRLLWIDDGGIDVFRCAADAELYVEHWALDDSDVIVDELGTRFEARAEKRLVRLHAIGDADWNLVRHTLTEAGCNAALDEEQPSALFDTLERGYGLTR